MSFLCAVIYVEVVHLAVCADNKLCFSVSQRHTVLNMLYISDIQLYSQKQILPRQELASLIEEAESLNKNGGFEEKLAAAKASVTEFMASVEAYNASSDAYKYQKYLAAVRKAYGNANLVILGNGVDQSAIYFGNIAGNSGNNSNSNSGSDSSSSSGNNSSSNSGNSSTQQ